MMQEALGASAGMKDCAFPKVLLNHLEESAFVIASNRNIETVYGASPLNRRVYFLFFIFCAYLILT